MHEVKDHKNITATQNRLFTATVARSEPRSSDLVGRKHTTKAKVQTHTDQKGNQGREPQSNSLSNQLITVSQAEAVHKPRSQILELRSQIPDLEPGRKSSIQQTDFPQSGQKGDILDKHSLTQQGRGSRFQKHRRGGGVQVKLMRVISHQQGQTRHTPASPSRRKPCSDPRKAASFYDCRH